jgi:hypothetical protein
MMYATVSRLEMSDACGRRSPRAPGMPHTRAMFTADDIDYVARLGKRGASSSAKWSSTSDGIGLHIRGPRNSSAC